MTAATKPGADALQDIATAEAMIAEHIEKYHDGDFEPEHEPEERISLRNIQYHLAGSLISDDGETFPAPEGLATKPDGGVESRRHAATGNKSGAAPEEEQSSSATSFERVSGPEDKALKPRAGVAPGPSGPAGGECVCQDQHRRGYCIERGCPYAIAPVGEDLEAKAREILAQEYDIGGGEGPYPTYAALARNGSGAFTICSIRAVQKALSATAPVGEPGKAFLYLGQDGKLGTTDGERLKKLLKGLPKTTIGTPVLPLYTAPPVTASVEEVARCIVGPRLPVPPISKYSLDELRNVRWGMSTAAERQDAIYAATAILALLSRKEGK